MDKPTPFGNYLPYSCQKIDEEDIHAVCSTLRSAFLTQGPSITQAETSLANYCQTPYALLCNSGTAALHLACMALGMDENSIGWVPSITFVATANALRYCGSQVDFVDIDHTRNMCPLALEEKLKSTPANKRPHLIILVHFAGYPIDMPQFSKLAKTYNFKIIEDAAHALGGRNHDNTPIGHCEFSECSILSFHPVKSITSGEGGCVTTRSTELINKMKLLRTHGIEKLPLWEYTQHMLGMNYRMTDIQASLLSSQLQKLDTFINIRKEIAKTYFQCLKNLPLKLPNSSQLEYSAHHLFVIEIEHETQNDLRQWVYHYCHAMNIGVQVHYIPVYYHPYYRKYCGENFSLPNTEGYYANCLSLPIHQKMTPDDAKRISQHLAYCLQQPLDAQDQ